MRNSIKQLLRTPFKAALLFLLLAASTALLVLGTQLWTDTQQSIDRVEENFTTIGTVEQKPDRMQIASGWDAADQAYYYENQPSFDTVIPMSVLNFDGANYVHSPEKRPYYTTSLPGYITQSANAPVMSMGLIAEFTPLETCTPSEPVPVRIERVLSGMNPGTDTIYVCNHWIEHPEALEAGKTYIAHLNTISNRHANSEPAMEYNFTKLQSSTQSDALGNRVESSVNMEGRTFDEVTDGFYETEQGRYWMALAEGITDISTWIPVLPTNSMTLLPSFHSYAVSVTDGRGITEEEFQSGKAVCLISVDFARMNHLAVGDKITLPLYHANYRYSPHITFGDTGGLWTFSFVNAENEVYESFSEETYEIVGLYYGAGAYGKQPGSIEIARNMFVIPMNSIKESDEKNIVEHGPMLHATTSFQIPNGTSAEYMEAFNQNVPTEIRDYLEVTFNDNGYEKVIKSLNNMRYIAILLFAVGLFAALAVVILMLYFFIVRQKKRTAIERSLGMTKKQCRVSLLSGILLLSAIAIVLGTVGSAFFVYHVQSMDLVNQNERTYSTDFSVWAADNADAAAQENTAEEASLSVALVSVAFPVLLFGFTTALSIVLVNENLKAEPILMLSSRSE